MSSARTRSNMTFWAICLLALCWSAAVAEAGPPGWLRSEDGLPTSGTFDPTLLRFGPHVYCLAADGLYAQLYNQPCFGWQKVYAPPGAAAFFPVGDYLFAWGGCPDLWWIKEGDAPDSQTWQHVTSTGLPTCASILPAGAYLIPRAVFGGAVYATLTYFKSAASTHTTFDVYRSSDLGKTSMSWTKVVSEGFGDPQNHDIGYLGVFNGKLVAVTTETHNGLFGDTAQYLDGIEVWESATGNTGSWSQINEDGFGTTAAGTSIKANCNFGAAAEYKGHLYIGTKGHLGAEVWRYDGSGLGGWTNVSPPTLGVFFGSGPGRVEDMAIFQDMLYLAEGFPTANLSRYDGTTWTLVEAGPNPFDPANAAIPGLAVLPSRPSPPAGGSGSTGDKLIALTDILGGGYQIWNYPFSTAPLSCSTLRQATISVSPKTATNELGPGQTHSLTATVNTAGVADFSDVWVTGSFEVTQKYQSFKALGFLDASGSLDFSYNAVQGPDGLNTDTITACFFNSEQSICDEATKTWVDTTAPTITIGTPQDGAAYALHDVVTAQYSAEDAVGVASTVASPLQPDGTIPTGVPGTQTFTVTAKDHSGNQATASATYTVLAPPVAQAGQDQTTLVGVPVTFDGSGSSDQDGTIASYAWDFGDGTSGVGVMVSHAYAAAGPKTVTLVVTDDDGLTGVDTAAVTVKTPLQGAQALSAAMAAFPLPPDVEAGLQDKLQAAIKSLNKGKITPAAINQLQAFINMIEAQRGKSIPDAQADLWIEEARRIIASIQAT